MIIDKIILTQDVRLFKDAKILELCMSVDMIKAKIDRLGYELINDENNKKTLNDIQNCVDIRLNSEMTFFVEGVLVDDKFTPIYDVPRGMLEFKNSRIALTKKDTLKLEDVTMLEKDGLIDYFKTFSSSGESVIKVKSNKHLNVLINDIVTSIFIPINISMPHPIYNSNYTTDENYIKTISKFLKENIDKMGDNPYKYIKSTLCEGVV